MTDKTAVCELIDLAIAIVLNQTTTKPFFLYDYREHYADGKLSAKSVLHCMSAYLLALVEFNVIRYSDIAHFEVARNNFLQRHEGKK